MHVIKRKTLIEVYEQPGRQDAKGALEAWYYEAKHAQWESPGRYKSAVSICQDSQGQPGHF
jgi:mRNA-degrading endonuclease HigB of HigAB toxin-antitoxin module